MFQEVKRIDYKDFIINVRVYCQNRHVGNIYTILMLAYKSYYNMAPPYLCELINKKERHVITRLGTDHHQLIMPPISKDCSNTFLERSFNYAAPCEWNILSEHIRTPNFDCFRKSVKTMLFTQQYGC